MQHFSGTQWKLDLAENWDGGVSGRSGPVWMEGRGQIGMEVSRRGVNAGDGGEDDVGVAGLGRGRSPPAGSRRIRRGAARLDRQGPDRGGSDRGRRRTAGSEWSGR